MSQSPEQPQGVHPAQPPRKRRRWLRRLALAAGAAAVAVVGLEIYLRQTMGALLGPAFDLRMYEVDASGWPATIPDYEGQITMMGHTTRVRLNRLGLRGGEVGPRQPNEKRILAVGDSQTFGMGVEAEETFGHQLESLLTRELERPVTVRTGAAPGYGTFDAVKVVERTLEPYDPDLIVVGLYLGNDLEDNFQVSKTAVDGYFVFGPPARMAESWRVRLATKVRTWFVIENFLRQRFPEWAIQIPDAQPEMAAFRDFPEKRERGLFLDCAQTTPGNVRILDRLEEALRELAAAAGRVPVLVAMIPSPPHCDDELYRVALRNQGRDPQEYARGTLQRLVAERCARVGLPALDLTAALESLPSYLDGFLKDDDHLSPRGHAAVAQRVAEHLATMAW